MKKTDVLQKIKLGLGVVGVVLLVGLVFNVSWSLLTNSVVDKLGFDNETSNFISFNYFADDSQSIEIEKPQILSDIRGKKLGFNNYFEFEVVAPKDYELKKKMYYDVILSPMSDEIDNSFIKIYLTDQTNKPVEGFKEVVPVLSALTDTNDGKVIYSGEFSKNDLKDRYRLRIWISDKYNKQVNSILAYQLHVRIK